MSTAVQKRWLFAAAFLLLLAPFAVADSMTLTSAGNIVMAGVYVGPYTATVNGVTTTVICDDFADETYLGESWTASSTTFSSLGSTLNTQKWNLSGSQQTQLYNEAAWLVTQLLAATNPTTIGEIQFAAWAVFDKNAIPYLSAYNSAWGAAAQGWLNQAASQNYSSADFSNFTVYVPTGDYKCPAGNCSTTPPQEFLSMKVPEGGNPIVYLLTAGLACFAAIFWRNKQGRELA